MLVKKEISNFSIIVRLINDVHQVINILQTV